VRLILVVLLALAWPATGHATPSQELARARAEFTRGQYQTAIAILAPQLQRIREQAQLIEAHYLLFVAYFYTNDHKRAREEIGALLYHDPDYTLDPVVESSLVYAFFEGVKNDLRLQRDEWRKKKEQEAEARRRPSREVLVTRVVHDRSPWENFIPFGVGQFRNGQSGKGWFFAVSQLVSGGTSVGLFVAQAVQYGIPSKGVPLSDIDGLRTRQVVQIGAGAVFLLLYGWSVIDAYANQKPRVEETREERPITLTDSPVPLVVPFVSASGEGGGVALHWTF
jgi:hypothetical protein